jgi:hypothetical protein
MLHQYSVLGAQPSPLQPPQSPPGASEFLGGQSRDFAPFVPNFQSRIETYELGGFGDGLRIIGALSFPRVTDVAVSHKQVEAVEGHAC